MRKIVMNLAFVSLLQRMAQSLGKVFCRGAYHESTTLVRLQFHYPREWIVHRSSTGFFAEQMLDLVSVRR